MLNGNACRQAAQSLRITNRVNNPNWSVVVASARATLHRFYAEESERNKKILRENPRYGARAIKANERDCDDLVAALREID